MTPFALVLIAGFLAHTITNVATRTPEEDAAPLRARIWRTVLDTLIVVLAITAATVAIWVFTGVHVPYWALLAASDVLLLTWRIRRHRQRTRERARLQAQFEQPSWGETA